MDLMHMDPGCEAAPLMETRPRAPSTRKRGAVLVAVVAAAALLATRSMRAPATLSEADAQLKFVSAGEGGFATGPSAERRLFGWGAPKRSVEEAFAVAFPSGGWEDLTFTEGRGLTVTKDCLLQWVSNELLGGPDPFADHGGQVPVPFPPQGPEPPDQLPPGHWVTYSRRQVCFIAAKSLIGAATEGYANGFLRFLETPAPALGKCTPASGEFGQSLWHLLAACAADPGLENGAQGPGLLVAKADPEPEVAAVRAAAGRPLATAGLRVCQYADGVDALSGVERVPPEACAQPTEAGPGRDFMTGGLQGQGMVDISASWLGGYIWGFACGIGGGQDERLMTYMPEVFLLSFFLSEAPGTVPAERNTPQLRQPAWILGARKMMNGLDGTARFNQPMRKNPGVQMTSDLTDVSIGGKAIRISSAQPFLAFMSDNQDFEISQGCAGLPTQGECDRYCRTRLARDNRFPWQRAVDARCPFAFDKQVRAWYGATALVSYSPQVQPVLKSVVRSLGTGPWGSGLWWGDSQVFMLAMWVAHAAAAATWGEGAPLPLDYYLYAAFTENPGNQCFVHGGDHCKACLASCGTPPPSSYWLPGFAYSHVDASFTDWGPPPNMPPAKACVDAETSCGTRGIVDIIAAYKNDTAATLWEDVERVLRNGASADKVGMPVFDELFTTKALR